MNEMTMLKANLMGGMNEYLKELADEDVWQMWITVMPDEVDEETLIEMAEDDEIWLDVVNRFTRCCRCLGVIK